MDLKGPEQVIPDCIDVVDLQLQYNVYKSCNFQDEFHCKKKLRVNKISLLKKLIMNEVNAF